MPNQPTFSIKPAKPRSPLYKIAQREIKGFIIQNVLKPDDLFPSEVENAT